MFARFKMFVLTRLHQAMLMGEKRDLIFLQVMDALMHALKGVMQRDEWSTAFAQMDSGIDLK